MARKALKPAVWLIGSLPLVWLAHAVGVEIRQPGAALGADPGEAVVLFLGTWGIRMLLLALAVTPLRRRLPWPDLARVRRLVGLFAFVYLCLHFVAYLGLLAGFDAATVVEDLGERPYITVGALGLLVLVPLAVTSTRGWQRRLGRRWRGLHRLVFVAAALGLLHLLWLTKDGYGEVLAYAGVFLLLMAERLGAWRKRHGQSGSTILRALQRGFSGGT
ncbi:MAG: sulfite oxidase heme-binding subunit YedZ [Pseudomonadota bacterium]